MPGAEDGRRAGVHPGRDRRAPPCRGPREGSDTELRALDLQVEAELAKTSLLTSASHEFRTPVLSNVTKYAPDGPCRVHLEATETGCTLLVTDEGPGLPARMHEPVFDAFVRADHHHPQPGTGIGLHLVRHLATLTGGSAAIVPSDRGLHVLVEISDQFPLELDARTSPSRPAVGGTDRDSERED